MAKTSRLLLCLWLVAFIGTYRASSQAIATVSPNVVNPGQSLETVYRIDVVFSSGYSTASGEDIATLISRNVSTKKWDCYDPRNFSVLLNAGRTTEKKVKISRVGYLGATNCASAFVASPYEAHRLQLWVDSDQTKWHSLVGPLTVNILNLQDEQGAKLTNVGSKPDAASLQWTLSIFTVSAQTANSEKLIDKTTAANAIYQIPLSSTYTLIGSARGGLYADTTDLFSSDERDSKSAFEAGLGYQYGLSGRWAIPLKLEQQVQGNQIATNLSTQTSLQVSFTTKWGKALTLSRGGPAWNVAPFVTAAFPYTHRINQYVAPAGSPLPVDDFAVNPSVALKSERLLSLGGDLNANPVIPPKFVLYWEGDLGMYYLPLQRTVAGSRRAEGTGDASILIPIADFLLIPGLSIDQTTQSNQMQIRLKYQDTVSATNNYVRTKGWTFGLELIVKH